MRKRQIDFFFRELDRALGRAAEIILLGASAGSLMGHIRPSLDIDFEIRLRGPARRTEVADRILATARKAAVAVNFSEDVSHWSMVSYLDYRRTARPYKKFGKLNVKLIAPAYWTLGKIARYHALDIRDVAAIIRKQKLQPAPLVRLWKRALASSELSLELGQFREHAVHFLKTRGPRLWGKTFRPDLYIRQL